MIIRHLRVALFLASSSSMNSGLSQVGIHNVPYTTCDYMHMMKDQRKLVRTSPSLRNLDLKSDISLRIYSVIYYGGDCRNAGELRTMPLDVFIVVVRYTSRSVLYDYSSIGSSLFRYNPNTRRQKGRLLSLRHLYHVLEPWKGGKMRLELRLPQHGLIFHPCVPSKNAGPRGKPRRCKIAFETSSMVHFESREVGSALPARSIWVHWV